MRGNWARKLAVTWLVLLSVITPVRADVELDGILVDRTISRFGRDFLYYYGSYWRDLPGTQGFTVTVHETVYPEAGTKLWITVNQDKVYETYFGRRYNNMKERADQAMISTIEHVADVKANIMLGQHDEQW
ncbi:curli production assembly/transport protein CsgE [Ferrimonas marina]|nr:curli production assembly/transport protein CsgE [Ferrimonas marina]